MLLKNFKNLIFLDDKLATKTAKILSLEAVSILYSNSGN